MSARTAVVAGATGLVGGCLVRELLALPQYSRVTALARQTLPLSHPKLRQVIVDYETLERSASALAADDAFCCLGTTIKAAGSRAAFERVDFDYVQELARLCSLIGVKQFLLVSSSGADARSRVFYSRVKGQAEEAVSRLPFEAVHVFRPSLLLGLRRDSRPLERLAQAALPMLSPLFLGPLRRYRPIEAAAVARAMTRWALRGKTQVNRLESDLIADLAR